MWGQEQFPTSADFYSGIIPTRVGTRKAHYLKSAPEQDHPHACGDKTKEIKENSGFAKSTA